MFHVSLRFILIWNIPGLFLHKRRFESDSEYCWNWKEALGDSSLLQKESFSSTSSSSPPSTNFTRVPLLKISPAAYILSFGQNCDIFGRNVKVFHFSNESWWGHVTRCQQRCKSTDWREKRWHCVHTMSPFFPPGWVPHMWGGSEEEGQPTMKHGRINSGGVWDGMGDGGKLWIKSKVLQEMVEALGMKCLLSSICNLLKKNFKGAEISLILQSIAIESYSWLLIFYSSYFSWRFSAPFLNVIFYNVFFPPLYHRTILSTIFHFASIPFWGKKLSSHNRWRRCSKEIMNDSY